MGTVRELLRFCEIRFPSWCWWYSLSHRNSPPNCNLLIFNYSNWTHNHFKWAHWKTFAVVSEKCWSLHSVSWWKWEDGVGEIKERFLGIIDVPKTDSESLVYQIKHFMTAKYIQVKRMRFMAFDGANVMSGERTGWYNYWYFLLK